MCEAFARVVRAMRSVRSRHPLAPSPHAAHRRPSPPHAQEMDRLTALNEDYKQAVAGGGGGLNKDTIVGGISFIVGLTYVRRPPDRAPVTPPRRDPLHARAARERVCVRRGGRNRGAQGRRGVSHRSHGWGCTADWPSVATQVSASLNEILKVATGGGNDASGTTIALNAVLGAAGVGYYFYRKGQSAE